MPVGYAPRGGTDLPARLFCTGLARVLGQPVVMETRPGAPLPACRPVRAAGAAGWPHTARTYFRHGHGDSVVAMAPLAHDPVEDLTLIMLISPDLNGIVSGPLFPARNLSGLLVQPRANPGRPIGTAGPTTAGRFAADLMRPKLGVQPALMPHGSTGPRPTKLAGGTLPFGITGASVAVPFLRDGRLRAYGVTSLACSRILPDVPPCHEAVSPGFETVAGARRLAARHGAGGGAAARRGDAWGGAGAERREVAGGKRGPGAAGHAGGAGQPHGGEHRQMDRRGARHNLRFRSN